MKILETAALVVVVVGGGGSGWSTARLAVEKEGLWWRRAEINRDFRGDFSVIRSIWRRRRKMGDFYRGLGFKREKEELLIFGRDKMK